MPETLTGPIFGPDARPEYVEQAKRQSERRQALFRKVDTIVARLARLHTYCPRHGCRRHRVCLHVAAPDARYHGPRPPCRLGEEADAAYESARRHVADAAAEAGEGSE